MLLLEKLKEQGWYLTEEGLKKLTTINNLQTEDVNKIISLALDWDLRDIAAGALPSKPDNNGTISGRIVLQLQKMRNISAPKTNEESTTAPRFLQLELSDGVNNIAALEFERIANLNLNVPPGTKVFVKTEKLKLLNGFLILKASDIQILGGKVEALVEKWELARQMLKYARSNRLSGSGGPPPWIAFDKRLDIRKEVLPTDKNFKSLQTANEKDKNSKENDEFNASRNQAIAEAAKAGQKKVFGGGQQNIIDHNVKKILEKGYSGEEAKQALESTNNNLERALYNLKRRYNIRSGSTETRIKPASVTAGGRVRDRGGIATVKEEAAALKPQTNVSLFDFLTDKLPSTASSTNTVQAEAVISNTNNERKSKDSNSSKSYNTKSTNAGGNRFENNMSSSFAANRSTTTTITEEKQSVQSRSNNFNRRQEECNQQYGNKNGKGGEKSISNKAKTQTQNYNKIQNQIPPSVYDNVNLTSGDNTNKNEKPFKKEREQTHRQSNSDYQSNKRSNEYKTTQRKPYQSREINRNNQDSRSNTNNYQQKQTQKSNNFDKDLDNLANSVSKVSIHSKKDLSSNTQVSRSRNQQQNSGSSKNQKSALVQLPKSENYPNNTHQQQQSQLTETQKLSSKSFQQNTKLASYSPQLGNGFAYDPSKIIGFQSKEANEYAMNMLKNQGMAIQQLQQQQTASQQVQQAAPMTPPIPHHHPQILNNQASASVAYMTQNLNMFVAPPQQVPTQFGMITGENWPWKEGDLCLAKYWDDGNYYDAKITAVSEKTCVVLFLGYGNHEEVLKSDCVPITDAQHIPLSAYQANITAPSITQSSPPIFQQRSNIHSGVTNHRYRSERQMYIPPPKRNNN